MKFVIIITLSVFFFSCKDKKIENRVLDREDEVSDYNNPSDLCDTILKIYKDDQKYRDLMVDPFFKILDSIIIAEGIEEVYKDLPEKKQLAYGKIARSIANKRKVFNTEAVEDSLMQLQIPLDNKNTELLIEIIKKHGFPNLPDCDGPKFPSMVLRHAQSKYWEEIEPLIKKEYQEGRMSSEQFLMVLNHINKRENYKETKKRIDKTIIQ